MVALAVGDSEGFEQGEGFVVFDSFGDDAAVGWGGVGGDFGDEIAGRGGGCGFVVLGIGDDAAVEFDGAEG